MYCTNCGQKQTGRFCAECGTPIAQTGGLPPTAIATDWQNEVRYAVLLYFPEVRDRLANVPSCTKEMTGEKWLELYDKAFKPITGVSVSTIAAIVAPIYARMGIKTGKKRTQTLAAPPGLVMVELLCALARHGLPLANVHQGESGCVFEATLPSDLWSFEGQVVVTIERLGSATKVEAATNIPGQLYDWGKSTRCLDQLFGDIDSKAA